MCNNSDNIIVDLNFKPMAVGMSKGQHKIGTYKGFNVYVRKLDNFHETLPRYFLQMSQKAFKGLNVKKLEKGYHVTKFTMTKEQVNQVKEELQK